MMMQEFTERTKYNPTAEEYHYIEESYYEFEGTSKDEFCKQWLKDKKSGKWELEYRLRKSLDDQKAMYEEKLKEIGERPFERGVFLGSGALKGIAEECHLKLQELTLTI